MTYYEEIHARTADMHYCGKDFHGSKIVIDVAELSPNHFKIMALRPNGDEIEAVSVGSLSEAKAEYDRMVRYHAKGESDGMYTMSDWEKDSVFKAAAGQEVSFAVYESFFNALPPLRLPRRFPYSGGFLTSEPYGFDPATKELTYAGFGKRNGHYYFIGYVTR